MVSVNSCYQSVQTILAQKRIFIEEKVKTTTYLVLPVSRSQNAGGKCPSLTANRLRMLKEIKYCIANRIPQFAMPCHINFTAGIFARENLTIPEAEEFPQCPL